MNDREGQAWKLGGRDDWNDLRDRGWLADHTPASLELLRLMDATPVPCGHSVITARRSDLYGWAGYGYCPSHSRWYWGSKRDQARQMPEHQPANRPAPGTAIVTDKGLAGEDTESFFAGPDLSLALIRPAAMTRTLRGASRTGYGSASGRSSGR